METEKDYVEVTVFDPGTASFVSAWVTYLCTLQLASEIEGAEVKKPDSIKLLATKEYAQSNWKYEHTNVWGFPYYVSAEEMRQVAHYFRLNGKLIRAISLLFRGLSVESVAHLPPLALTAQDAWGNRGVLVDEDGWTKNAALFMDRRFKNLAEMNADNAAPSESGLRLFFNEVFADG